MHARTRFAPSPTGDLHIGGARTALFNWLFARASNGEFILRMEDTDLERSNAVYELNIIEDLAWLGLIWDEGPDIGGPFGPYRQSERIALYREHAGRLLEKGLAYRCYCSRDRLEELKAERLSRGLPPRYDRKCADINVSDAPSDRIPTIRFRVPGKRVEFIDGVHGPIGFEDDAFGDFVIIGSDGIATYNFASVVDDSLMEMTHIIRGDDHIPNTPRQMLLYEALGLEAPKYLHIPLVVTPEGAPLGKRTGAATIRELRAGEIVTKALLNTLARLGWAPPDTLLSLEEMAAAFDASKLSKSPSVYDPARLGSFNKAAIEEIDAAVLLGLASIIENKETLAAARAVKGNAATVAEFKTLLAPFIAEPEFSETAIAALKENGAKEVLAAFAREAERTDADVIEEARYKTIIADIKKATGARGKALFMPLRAALTGATVGIELVNVIELLGRDRAVERARRFAG